MNSKMTTNSQLSTNEPKRKEKQLKQKLSKLEQGQNHRNGNTRRVISGEGERREWGKMYRE